MRTALVAFLTAATLGATSAPTDASATVTIWLVWEATTGVGGVGGDQLIVQAGETVTLGIRMRTDEPLGGHSFSLAFDTDLADELTVLAPHGGRDWLGISFGTGPSRTYYGPSIYNSHTVTESSTAIPGQISSFSSVRVGPLFLPVGTYSIGTVRFVVNSPRLDGPDIFVGLFATGVDGVLDASNLLLPASSLVFGTASIGILPEPGTAALLGLGLAGIAAIRSPMIGKHRHFPRIRSSFTRRS